MVFKKVQTLWNTDCFFPTNDSIFNFKIFKHTKTENSISNRVLFVTAARGGN